MSETFENEVWRDMVGYEGLYKISNKGRIFSLDRIRSNGVLYKGKELKISLGKVGYLTVRLSINGISKLLYLHRLLAMSFISNLNNYSEINHKNGIKLDNRVENLEWVTHQKNMQHACETGLLKHKGSQNALSKLNELQVLEIRKLGNKNNPNRLSSRLIGIKYNINDRHIRAILTKECWKHIL